MYSYFKSHPDEIYMLILDKSHTMEEAATIEEQGMVVRIIDSNISAYRKCIDSG